MWVGVVTLVVRSSHADGQPVGEPAPTEPQPSEPQPSEPQPSATPSPQEGAADQAEGEKDKKDEAEKKKKKKLQFTGRVFARGSLIDAEGGSGVVGRTTLESARAGARYRSHGLRVEIEAELANKAKIKDAFVQLRVHDGEPKVEVRAGNFKMPFSAIQLTSIWKLPMADRGLIDNVLVKRLQIAGRAVGAMAAVELPGAWRPAVRAGVFQGTDDADNGLAVGAPDRFGHDAVVRVTARPVHGLELGAAGSVRSGALLDSAPLVIRRGYGAELDATLDVALGPGRLRGWLEGMIGTSWLVGGTDPSHHLTRFLETRAIAAWRLGGGERRARYVEIYGLAGALDPDRIIDRDRVVEAAAGISYGASDVWCVQAEAEVWRFGDNAPIGISELAVAPADSITVLVQLGARL
jgi:hypothetical protein